MAYHYTYRVEWSTDTEQYMAQCIGNHRTSRVGADGTSRRSRT